MAPTPRRTFSGVVESWLSTFPSANTRAAYASDTKQFENWCTAVGVDPLSAGARDLDRFREASALEDAAPATLNRRLSAVTSLCAFAAAAAAAADPRPGRPPVSRAPSPRESSAAILGDGEAAALLAAADAMSARSGVLVRLLMLDGLKVGEAVRADARDVSGRPPRMSMAVNGSLPRTITLHPDTAAVLDAYRSRRRDGPLLLSESRANEPNARARLTRFGVDYVVKQAAHAAGLSNPVSGNTLRRRYVMSAHASGEDLDVIRRNAGHVDERTTRRYLSSQ